MRRSQSLRQTRLLTVLSMLLVVSAACGRVGSASESEEVACTVAGSTRFSTTYLDGPESSREGFIATETGRRLERFFTVGDGAPEDFLYLDAEGFSVVSDSLVLGYLDGLPFVVFGLDGDRVTGHGSCHPNLVSGDRVTYRWQPVRPIDTDAITLPIEVDGEGCVTNGDTDVTTEIDSVDVVEDADSVRIVVWTRERERFLGDLLGGCAGVGVLIDAEAVLAVPLGDRTLIDAGTIPDTVIRRDDQPDEDPPND
jgi:hypothetical protein